MGKTLDLGNCYTLVVANLQTNFLDYNSVQSYNLIVEDASGDELAVMDATMEFVRDEYPDGIGWKWLKKIVRDIAFHYALHNDLKLVF